MSAKICTVTIATVNLAAEEGEAATETIVYCTKARALPQLKEYLKRLEAEGLALKASD